MSVNSKMTAVADPIRILKGTSGKMGLDAMASNLGEVVNECDTQADLIAQIKTALADKAAGGVELPALGDDVRGAASDMASGKQLYDDEGNPVTGNLYELTSGGYLSDSNASVIRTSGGKLYTTSTAEVERIVRKGAQIFTYLNPADFGNATAADVRAGVYFTSENGLKTPGEALLPGGGSVYPDGAFAPVTSFTDGKQYALVSMIDGVRRYINTTTYNDYTMNATEITIGEDAGDYVIFGATPALFTAVASGNGFLLQNGSNYLHGTSSGGTSLRVGTTQMVWTVDNSATGGFSDGKYYSKEDADAVWLMNTDGGYNWSIKYETAGSFGYDREGRDSTYSTGFVSFILYEYVAGEGESNPIVDTSDATAKANDIVAGEIAYVNGCRVEGNVREISADDDYCVDDEFGVKGKMLTSTLASATFPMDQDTLFRKGTDVEFRFPVSQLGISGGSGGLPSGVSALATGTYTPTSNITKDFTIDHGLGVVPNFYLFLPVDAISSSDFAGCLTAQVGVKKDFSSSSTAYNGFYVRQQVSSSGTSYTTGTTNLTNADERFTKDNITVYAASSAKLNAGTTYRWVCGVADGI